MLVSVIADAIAVRYAKNSIMTEKLARRGLHIHTDYEPDVLQQVTVGETMSKEFDTVPVSMRVPNWRSASPSAIQASPIIRACSSWTPMAGWRES